MAINSSLISSNQVASSVPFDNVAAPSFASTDVQAAIKEIRDQTSFNSATQVTTAAGTRTLTITDVYTQFFTGTAVGYNIKLPDATLFPGNAPPNSAYFQLFNATNQTIQIKDGSGANLFVLGQNSVGFLWLHSDPNSAGVWIYSQTSISTANGIVTYDVTSTTAFSNGSNAYVLVTGMTVTPQAGTYAVWINASATGSGSGQNLLLAIAKGGTGVADSVRSGASPSGSHIFIISTMSIVYFDGATDCSMQINAVGSNMTINQRSMLLIRLGT